MDDKMTILENLHRMAALLSDATLDRSGLQERRWLEKIAIRKQILAIIRHMDSPNESRARGTDTG